MGFSETEIEEEDLRFGEIIPLKYVKFFENTEDENYDDIYRNIMKKFMKKTLIVCCIF